MAKPWGRYEIDFLDHPKFRALHANSFFLWWEVKNYCDKFHTDGRFPREMLRTFRHHSSKAIGQLTMSCGVKPNGDPYAPLWEPQDIGGVAYLKMHDYLDHNDCRDEVLARIQDAEDKAAIRRAKDRERQAQYRAERKAVLADLEKRHVTRDSPRDMRDSHSDVTPQTRPQTETPTPTPTEVVPTERRTPSRTSAHGPLPGFARLRVFRWMVEQLTASVGAADFDLEDWLLRLEADTKLVIPADDKERWKWLQTAFDHELRSRGLMTDAPQAPTNKRVAGLVTGGNAFLRRNQA